MHYVARVVIEQVFPAIEPSGPTAYRGTKVERRVNEVATVVTKAEDLTTLIKKVDSHLAAELQLSEDA